jgi:hypothetical protein
MIDVGSMPYGPKSLRWAQVRWVLGGLTALLVGFGLVLDLPQLVAFGIFLPGLMLFATWLQRRETAKWADPFEALGVDAGDGLTRLRRDPDEARRLRGRVEKVCVIRNIQITSGRYGGAGNDPSTYTCFLVLSDGGTEELETRGDLTSVQNDARWLALMLEATYVDAAYGSPVEYPPPTRSTGPGR